MARKNGELTYKQKDFCDEFIICLNGTQSYIKAYKCKNAKVAKTEASKLMSKPNIASYIAEKRRILEEKTGITQEYVLKGLKEVAERCLESVPVMKFNYEDKRMEHVTETIDGKEVGVYEFNGRDANRAFELLGKHLGMFKEKLEISGVDNLADRIKKSREIADNAK
jgi:phage terminase small subunit